MVDLTESAENAGEEFVLIASLGLLLLTEGLVLGLQELQLLSQFPVRGDVTLTDWSHLLQSVCKNHEERCKGSHFLI